MQLAIAAGLVLVIILLIAILVRLGRAANGEQASQQLSSAVNSLNSRLDSVQQGLLTNINATVNGSSQTLTASVATMKEETRSRISEIIAAFTSQTRSSFDSFREQTENRFAAVESRLTTRVSELQNSTTLALAEARREQSETLNATNTALLEKFDKLQASSEVKLAEIRRSVEDKLAENLGKNVDAFKEMTAGIAELKSTGQRIAQVGEEIGELTDILRSPKPRGDFGEFELENMIRDIIPPDHYRIKAQVNGTLADAAILLKDGLLCIDSKFPLDNYRKAVDPAITEDEREHAAKAFEADVKGHLQAIADKYIIPGATLDLALMFVPAESVYYHICLNQDLQAHCRQLKVLPVSPNTLYAYLQVLAIGFRGMKVQEAAKRIEVVLLRMKREFDIFKSTFRLVGSHLQNAQNRFADANTAAEQFSVTLDRLQFGATEPPVALPQAPLNDASQEQVPTAPQADSVGPQPT